MIVVARLVHNHQIFWSLPPFVHPMVGSSTKMFLEEMRALELPNVMPWGVSIEVEEINNVC